MTTTHDYAASPASIACLRYALSPLAGAAQRVLGGNTGLPAGAVECRDQGLVAAATPMATGFFERAALRIAEDGESDLLLIRHGLLPELLDPVRVDVVLRTAAGPALMANTSFFRDRGGGLFLVPASSSRLIISITGFGLGLSLTPPWTSSDERSDGLTRAAAEMLRGCGLARR